MIGSTVGKYRLVAQIGEGAMGKVYSAEHTVLGGPAAVKILMRQFTRDAVTVDRFFHEAKATSAIRHSSIIEVFDYGRLDNGQAWIAMELLRGQTLTKLLEHSGGKLDPALVQQLGSQILGALDAAHVVGVVHRDLKPDNIFLVPDNGVPGGLRVKILDFGIAKLAGDRFGPKKKTDGGAILGTPAYMAPEQCKGGDGIDSRADLYAFGCILFELLSGRPPFDARGGPEVMNMHIYEPAPRLSAYAPELPLELEVLVAKLLIKNPADRTPSAAYALATLERIALMPAAAQPVMLPPVEGQRGQPARSTAVLPPRGAPRWLLPVVVLAIAIGIAVAAVIVIGGSGDVPT